MAAAQLLSSFPLYFCFSPSSNIISKTFSQSPLVFFPSFCAPFPKGLFFHRLCFSNITVKYNLSNGLFSFSSSMAFLWGRDTGVCYKEQRGDKPTQATQASTQRSQQFEKADKGAILALYPCFPRANSALFFFLFLTQGPPLAEEPKPRHTEKAQTAIGVGVTSTEPRQEVIRADLGRWL